MIEWIIGTETVVAEKKKSTSPEKTDVLGKCPVPGERA